MSSEGTYDIIFAGGGTAACITAGRLSDADPNLKILVLEAGGHSEELFYHLQPARYFGNLLVPRDAFSFHFGKGGKGTGERTHLVPSGRAVGGGSSINFLMYMRPAPSDYDDWETIHGNKGWSSKELIPLLKKSETYQPNPNDPGHGSSGPTKISFAKGFSNIGQEMLAVGPVLEKSNTGTAKDINDFSDNAINNWAPVQRYIDGNTGRRSDAAHNYIYNRERKNLKVLTRAKVQRIIFEGTRAVGVEYVNDDVARAKGVTEPIAIKASRLVVLSAGAFGNPSILERSGVGASEVLKKNGVKQLVDLPGVGENYMDHNMMFLPYHASDDADTMDQAFRGTEEEIAPLVEEWKQGKGIFGNNGIDAGIKLRPNEAELKKLGPVFDERWKTYYADKHDKPILLMATMAAYVGLNPAVPRGKYFSIAYFSAHPISTGHVHITSGTDSYSPLDFGPNFLGNPADVVVLRWAYKRGREVARRMKYFKGELEIGHPRFPEGSAAAVGKEKSPVPIDAPRIVYTEEDDAAIDEYHKETVETTWHSIGTAAMKPREKGGVVDSKLNVYGTQGLKVADTSITPGNVAANTYSTAIAIGEKAAVIIAEELGIKGVTAA